MGRTGEPLGTGMSPGVVLIDPMASTDKMQMLPSSDKTTASRRRALLIFADAAHMDCRRRGWPSAFGQLLEIRDVSSYDGQGFALHLFTSPAFRRPMPPSFAVHFQRGASFGERLENAVESLAHLGYQDIVIVGQDCPGLEPADVRRAFALLDTCALVVGPDHRGGCYLIAIHAKDRMMLKGVVWQKNKDFRQIQRGFHPNDTCILPVKLDLDTLGDVYLLAYSASRLGHVARLLLRLLTAKWDVLQHAESSDTLRRQRTDWQLPPPPFHALLPIA